ncbi:MAG TPA: hypothetical protein VFX61_16620 [Micromonosporaceae bacterium]|nr:hypothetical protein [Micromonosporaceae bacterium]
MSEYARLIEQLAGVAARVEAQRAEAELWRQQQCAAAERAVARAEAAVRQAEEEIEAARRQIQTVDAAAAELWQELGRRLPVAHRLGDPPAPTPGATASPETLLDGVQELLDHARRPRFLPSSVYPLLAVLGALGAGAAYALGFAARLGGARHGGDLASGLPALSLVVTLLGPLVGLVPAKLLAERRHAVLNPRAVVIVVAAGLVSTATLFALFR